MTDVGNVIESGANGRLLTAREDLSALLTAATGEPKVVLHFHGGLVDREAGLAISARLGAVYRDAGAFPITFVWHSGLMEVLSGNLRQIAQEQLFRKLRTKVLKYAVGRLEEAAGLKAGLGPAPPPPESQVEEELRLALEEEEREPYADLTGEPDEAADAAAAQSLERELRGDPVVQGVVAAVVLDEGDVADVDGGTRGLGVTPVAPGSLDGDIRTAIVDDNQDAGERGLLSTAALVKKAVEVFLKVLQRFRAHTDHGVYVTVVEELMRALYAASVGAAVWSAMKGETEDTFKLDAQERAGHAFVEDFARMLADGVRPELTLVGHSTGAVFIVNLLEALDQKRADPEHPLPADFTVKHVVFLAPALRSDLFAGTLQRHASLVEDFRMFSMSDEAERADRLVGPVYPRSLLYLVSGLLETDQDGKSAVVPIVGLQRWCDGVRATTPELQAVKSYIEEPGHVVWSPAGGSLGFSSAATTHSGFDDDDEVLASVKHLIQN